MSAAGARLQIGGRARVEEGLSQQVGVAKGEMRTKFIPSNFDLIW